MVICLVDKKLLGGCRQKHCGDWYNKVTESTLKQPIVNFRWFVKYYSSNENTVQNDSFSIRGRTKGLMRMLKTATEI